MYHSNMKLYVPEFQKLVSFELTSNINIFDSRTATEEEGELMSYSYFAYLKILKRLYSNLMRHIGGTFRKYFHGTYIPTARQLIQQ